MVIHNVPDRKISPTTSAPLAALRPPARLAAARNGLLVLCSLTLWLPAPWTAAALAEPVDVGDGPACELQAAHGESYGTKLQWLDSPQQAGRIAREEDKLVFVMHLSGNFAREEFT